MYDIKFIRNHPEEFDRIMKSRGLTAIAQEILTIDHNNRAQIQQIQTLQARRNSINKDIGYLKQSQNHDEILALTTESAELDKQIKAIKATLQTEKLHNLLDYLPNILDKRVPIGLTEKENLEIRKWGQVREFSFAPKAHYELGEDLNLMDFKQTAYVSGARFVTLKGQLARLERALAMFMLDMHTQEYGYTEICHPLLVRDQAMYGVGQLPKFAEDSFQTTHGLRLIPTSEVNLTNSIANTILDHTELPLRLTAYANCFRAEAGSAGTNTRGMLRQHQFSKVELVSIVQPEQADDELERMTGIAEQVLQRLGLPYRIVLLSSGETGFAAKITYDLEVWLPSQNKYCEISSCSNCGDFQAHRMKASFYDHMRKTRFVHTLNGSALAIGRTLVTVMENYQNSNGNITIPQVLQKYMNNAEVIQVKQ